MSTDSTVAAEQLSIFKTWLRPRFTFYPEMTITARQQVHEEKEEETEGLWTLRKGWNVKIQDLGVDGWVRQLLPPERGSTSSKRFWSSATWATAGASVMTVGVSCSASCEMWRHWSVRFHDLMENVSRLELWCCFIFEFIGTLLRSFWRAVHLQQLLLSRNTEFPVDGSSCDFETWAVVRRDDKLWLWFD